jgi:hypothetical protein
MDMAKKGTATKTRQQTFGGGTIMSQTRVTDLYSLLEHIRARPLMYLRQKSVDELECACRWCSIALGIHGIDEVGTRFNGRFSEYLQRRFDWGLACGWARAIRDHTAGKEVAFERFFELLEEFKHERS